MAEVLEFPSREARAYAFLEQELTALLQARGADQPLINFATRTLREVYGELAESGDHTFRVDLPANTTVDEAQRMQQQIGEGLDTRRREHHQVVIRMAARLVLAEMQLFQQRRDDG